MCVGCQEMRQKKELIRIVRTPTGEVVIDASGKKAGRGVYLCNKQACLNKAVREKKLERSLKQEICPNIYEELKQNIGQK